MASNVQSNMIHVSINDTMDVAKARRQGMDMARAMGFSQPDATKIAVVISELGRNIVLYAGHGSITLLASGEGSKYIKIIAKDEGPGIPNVDAVLAGGFTTSGGLGLGVSGSKKLVDDFRIVSEPGWGTVITAVKLLR